MTFLKRMKRIIRIFTKILIRMTRGIRFIRFKDCF